jgi:hypothetical protein
MTLPNLPFGSTTAADLAENVTMPDQLGATLQDHSEEWYAAQTGARYPSAVEGTSAGGPIGDGVLGVVNGMAAKLTSDVAQSDPADITTKADLESMVPNFFSLPLTSIFDPLLGALMGGGGGGVLGAIGSFFSGKWLQADQTAVKAQEIQTGITSGWVEGPIEGSDIEVYDTMAAIRSLVAGGGFTRFNKLSTGVWSMPVAVTELVVIVIAAGENGVGGNGSAALTGDAWGGAGGRGGGYKAVSLDPNSLTGIHFTIGVNGAPTVARKDSASGVVLVDAVVGAPGAMATPYGYSASASSAGGGGAGGVGFRASGDGIVARPYGDGMPGVSTPAAAAGAGGSGGGYSGTSGGAGVAVAPNASVPCGGGGGGGGRGGNGFATGYSSIPGGSGGSGGFPGGGGGGGGGGGIHSPLPFPSQRGPGGPGGPGAAGVAIVLYR